MGYLIRKISRSKWTACDQDLETPLSADAITNCLKTSQNSLSVWYAKDKDSIVEAKLALLMSLSTLDTIDIVILSEEKIAESELVLEKSEGDTAAKSLKSLHRDIAKLSVDELKKVATLIRAEIVEKKVERITAGEFKKLLKEAVEKNICDKDDLPSSLAKNI